MHHSRVCRCFIYAISMNAAGVIGDVLVIVWIARSPRGALFRDQGDAVARFVPEE
ncbi:MAG: hypothetical protein AB4911_18025 [Oscillochloridaceae bacterium umkhey_bin13]